MLLRYANLAIGLLLLICGAATLYAPDIFTKLYGMVLPTPESRVAIRAIIGGGELALSIVFLAGGRLGFTQITLVRLALILFCGVLLARVISIYFEQSYSTTLIRELVIEAGILAFLVMLARKKA